MSEWPTYLIMVLARDARASENRFNFEHLKVGHRHLCLQALQAKMFCNAYHDRLFNFCHFPAWEYKRGFSSGWVSVVNIKQLSRRTKSSFSSFLCKFFFFYSSFVSGRLLTLTDRLQASEEVARKPELLFVSTGRKSRTISWDGMSFSEKVLKKIFFKQSNLKELADTLAVSWKSITYSLTQWQLHSLSSSVQIY